MSSYIPFEKFLALYNGETTLPLYSLSSIDEWEKFKIPVISLFDTIFNVFPRSKNVSWINDTMKRYEKLENGVNNALTVLIDRSTGWQGDKAIDIKFFKKSP